MSKKESRDEFSNKTHLIEVGTVFVPVSDQDMALDFYMGKLGFEKRVDIIYGGSHRWVEVAPPGSINRIALVPVSEGIPSFGDQTYCALTTKDIAADFEKLRRSGVDVIDEKIGQKGTSRKGLVSTEITINDPMPPQFSFRDLDGNRFLIVQPS